ncbi:uncharacterized protein LOC143021997 [Oratosquilla oratoria]|uniref:uncharacterized protein LOC143021997 n=1 Tax=Oratosquilla oratoria TaxID=337810 RepID=UPI003F75CE7D
MPSSTSMSSRYESELDAVIKGTNLALKWGLREIEIRTDLATVAGWMNSVLTAEKRVRTKGAAEILVKRRLGILRELIDEFGMKIRVRKVSSEANKADALTRVKKSWLKAKEEQEEKLEMCAAGSFRAKELHETHHLGVDRSLFLARKVNPNISREEVRHAVRACARCQSINPAPRPHSAGELCVEENWGRLAIDVTHYRGTRYLSMVDCGPGRFGIWRELKAETGEEIARVMNEVFLERGPVDEVLMDNGNGFFRAAYRPSGNGIVERHHRTIKAIAERARIPQTEAVFWYNISPRSGQDDHSVPQKAVFKYDWRHPLQGPKLPANAEEGPASVQVGEEVWVRPRDRKCTSQWTEVNSRNNVSVEGVPRHILYIRQVVSEGEDEEEGHGATTEEDGVSQRPQRERRPPRWLQDYDVEEREDEEQVDL